MNRFEIIDNEAGHERLRKLLESAGLNREWHCSLKVGEREEGLEIWARKALPKIIPWVEENHDDPESLEQVVIGLRVWHNVTDRAIVTTAPGVRIYDELCARVPGMQIIPGLKTNELLPHRFDYVEGWASIAAELAVMAEATGSKIVVLENESAVEKYRLGHQNVNWAQFRKCLAQLPRDLTIWLYPPMGGENDDEQDRMGSLSGEVADQCINVALLDYQSCGGPRGLTYSWSIKGRKKLDEIVRRVPGASILRMLYFYGPGSKYWMDGQILEALGAVGDDEVIIYPGAKRWVEAAKEFAKVLGNVAGAEIETVSGESR